MTLSIVQASSKADNKLPPGATIKTIIGDPLRLALGGWRYFPAGVFDPPWADGISIITPPPGPLWVRFPEDRQFGVVVLRFHLRPSDRADDSALFEHICHDHSLRADKGGVSLYPL